MNKKIVIPAVIVVLLVIAGAVFGMRGNQKKPVAQTTNTTTEEEESVKPADPSIAVTVTPHPTKTNTVVLHVTGLNAKYVKVAYELSYDAKGVVQGVTSKPVDVTDQTEFTRDDIYLGTCSKNVCTPHQGVTKITAILEFTDKSGQKSELSKDFDLK